MTDSRRHPVSRRLSDILAANPVLAALHARAARQQQVIEVIAPVCSRLLPGFDPALPGRCLLSGHRLRITVLNAPQAAKLRQSIPGMVKILQAQGFEGIEIELGIQPAPMPYPGGSRSVVLAGLAVGQADGPTPTQTAVASSSRALLEFSERLASSLSDTPLGQAAQRLRESVARRAAAPGTHAPELTGGKSPP